MNNDPYAIVPWSAADVVDIPAEKRSPADIVKFGEATLSPRDMKAIVHGFEAQSYEMVSTFVWTKAAAALKRRVSTLGMEFVGEMLGRPDLDDDSDPATSIGDHEAISLAEDLGMITTTQALRLKHALQLVTHFSAESTDDDADEAMQMEEAIVLLRTCITSILGKPRFEAALQFADFRQRLAERTLKATDSDVAAIKSSPYFFIRTTLSVLLAAVKTAQGAGLEHAVGNTMLLVPALWELLRAPEKWQIGQAYAEVNSAGNRLASAGLKKTLLAVKGFDYVPESLRSNTFTEAAAKVLSSHFAFNNFYNEAEPMKALAALGTSIPRPAFAKVMEATLAVRLGNRWGRANHAQDAAEDVLNLLRPAQWQYYLDECLPRDRTVLDKLSFDDRPIKHWRELVQELSLDAEPPINARVVALLKASRKTPPGDVLQAVKDKALALRNQQSR